MTDQDVKKAVTARETARKQAEIESAWRQRERDTSGYYPRRRARRASSAGECREADGQALPDYLE